MDEKTKMSDASEHPNGTTPSSTSQTKQFQQKISGKAWGVLQFRKLRSFPFSVFFIVGNEFCERFSYYGMRAVLVLFLFNQLKFSEDSSTAIYHGFIVLCYLLPLFGAVISDSCLGKYGTILSLSIIYAIGNIIVSVSAIPIIRGVNVALVAVGLIIIAFGTGGIKPCVAAFGGDQFQETQTDMLRRFFSLFYFSINAGSVISTLLTPVLRSYINCFDTCECFALAFGVPAFLMIISLVIFLLGTRYYIIKKPQKEAARLYFDVPTSILTAIYRRFASGKISGKKLLHYACPKYSVDFMNDVGLFLRVLVMFVPLPIFWALFDQQGSRWTLQATRMNGQLGKFTIQPDQMQALNPILILVFIPIFETIVYPLFGKCHLLKRPLQRMVLGMLFGGLAFVVAGFIQLEVQSAQQTLKTGESKLALYNSAPFPITYSLQGLEFSNQSLNRGEGFVYLSPKLNEVNLTVFSMMDDNLNYTFELHEFNITQIYITYTEDDGLDLILNEYTEYIPGGGDSNIQIISLVDNTILSDYSIVIKQEGSTVSECDSPPFENNLTEFGQVSDLANITVGRYEYVIEGLSMENLTQSSVIDQDFKSGAVYTIVVTSFFSESKWSYNLSVVEIDPPNSVSLFLQVPMYVLITAGEVMFSVTGLEFAYSQAPVSMKAMCQAAWLLTVAAGNFVVIIVAESSIFENRAIEFFFFAILIGVVTLIFAVMSYFYKYVSLGEQEENLTVDDNKDESAALLADNSPQTGEEPKKFYNSESEF